MAQSFWHGGLFSFAFAWLSGLWQLCAGSMQLQTSEWSSSTLEGAENTIEKRAPRAITD